MLWEGALSATIEFYSVQDEWGEFSNFALYPIRLKGKVWPTSEHYFQGQKFTEKRLQEQVRKANSAGSESVGELIPPPPSAFFKGADAGDVVEGLQVLQQSRQLLILVGTLVISH